MIPQPPRSTLFPYTTLFRSKTIKTKEIFDGRIISVQVDDVKLPDGNIGKREIVKHPGAVAIIAITDDDKIIFVHQYRKTLEKSILEIPAGRLEEGEKPERTAVRELEEETGYTTDKLTYVTSFYTSPGFANEIIHIYMTTSLKKLTEVVSGDEDEFIEIKKLTLDEAVQYVRENKIQDAKTSYAVLYLQLLEKRN